LGKFYELYDSDAEIGINKLSAALAQCAQLALRPGTKSRPQQRTAMSRQPLTVNTLCIWLMSRTRCFRRKMTAMTGRRARCGFPEGALESYSQRFLELGHQGSPAARSGAC